ncbi:hypothetical protein [Halobacteriovorax sp. DA5]|uniref:hypothetical protein n=1 Tax=Halobacteriovorax sp. DA5 TaxID=2067553 RepID=UPI000CD0F6D2|nr:hypothetical protein [Halobacteriovorax sp. DA5]POB14663.1 hypothetical protein C0Z22_06090 [Halobacteriovorax sp. DA5]
MIWPFNIISKRYFGRDWVGVWYELLKERGENDQCVIGRAKWHDGNLLSPEYFEYSHSLMDGSASIPYYLTQLGAKRTPVYSNYHKKISFWKHLMLALKAKDISPASAPEWKEKNDNRPKDNYEFEVGVLNHEETKAFNDFLKEKKLSQNVVLLELINHHVFSLIKDDAQELRYSWLLPINIRGIVNKKSSYENHTSFVQLRLNANSDYNEIRNGFSQKVKTLNHIGLWWVHHIGVLFGRNYMAKLSRNSATKNFWLGTFSNIGAWDVSDESYKSLGQDEVWFATTPGSKNFPVGIVAMEFNGQLSLSFKIHPYIAKDNRGAAKALLAKIIADIKFNYS